MPPPCASATALSEGGGAGGGPLTHVRVLRSYGRAKRRLAEQRRRRAIITAMCDRISPPPPLPGRAAAAAGHRRMRARSSPRCSRTERQRRRATDACAYPPCCHCSCRRSMMNSLHTAGLCRRAAVAAASAQQGWLGGICVGTLGTWLNGLNSLIKDFNHGCIEGSLLHN